MNQFKTDIKVTIENPLNVTLKKIKFISILVNECSDLFHLFLEIITQKKSSNFALEMKTIYVGLHTEKRIFEI